MTETATSKFHKKYGAALDDLNADINVTFRKEKRDFYDFYAQRLPMMERVRAAYQNLLHLMTSDIDSGAPKIVSRIKDRSECIAKFERSYRNKAEKEKRDKYKIREYITDMIGVRIICLYEDDVYKIQDIIKNNFEILDVTDKTKILEKSVEKFGYKGLHLDICLNNTRSKLPEFSGFGDFSVEVQIRSIVQDAWSEVDHKLKYKRSIPDRLKRKVIRIAALFELADQEFTNIRKDTEMLESLPNSYDLTPNRKIDSFSFISVMKDYFVNYNFENDDGSESARKIDGFVEEILSYDSALSDSDFKEIMSEYIPKFESYKNWKADNGGYRLNPFTTTRHTLYWKNPKIFKDLLFEGQRKAFDEWLRNS